MAAWRPAVQPLLAEQEGQELGHCPRGLVDPTDIAFRFDSGQRPF